MSHQALKAKTPPGGAASFRSDCEFDLVAGQFQQGPHMIGE